MRSVLTSLLLAIPAIAAAAPCEREDAYAAEVVTDYLDSWDNVRQFHGQFRSCLEGSVLEGAHDRMQQLWLKRWTDTPRMAALMKGDAEFREFVLGALRNENFPQEAFGAIVRNAAQRCQPSFRDFCEQVKMEARRK